jgi:hypothetical protein
MAGARSAPRGNVGWTWGVGLPWADCGENRTIRPYLTLTKSMPRLLPGRHDHRRLCRVSSHETGAALIYTLSTTLFFFHHVTGNLGGGEIGLTFWLFSFWDGFNNGFEILGGAW